MSRRFTIGRDKNCDIPVADDSVSRLHAEIWLADDGALMMADRGSSNGTTLLRSGQSFPLRQDVLMPGDQIRLGGVLLAVTDLIAAVETNIPGALTPKAAQGAGKPRAPFPPPPPALRPPPPLPPGGPPPPPPADTMPPAATPPGYGPPAPPSARRVLVRCHCGAIKTQGESCPSCRQ